MANQNQVEKAVGKTPAPQSILSIVKQAAKETKLNEVHLVKVAATQIRLNPKLAQCTPASFIGALITLEQVGLEPVAGRAYLLPFLNNRKTTVNGRDVWTKVLEVQALIGYKGMSDLFYKHENALTIEMHARHDKDQFSYEYGTQSYLRHKPADGDRGEAVGYYAVAKLKNGGNMFLYMSKSESIEHGQKHSKVFNKKDQKFMPNTPWATDLDAMCKKTVLLQLAKSLPLSIETQKALSIDETTREYRPGIDMTDIADETNWQDDQIEEVEVEAKTPNPLPQKTLENIAIAATKVGVKIFQRELGDMGYEKVDQITKQEEADKLLANLMNASK